MWDKDIVDLLITKYKEHENLYDARNPMYVDRVKRSNSLDEICNKLRELKSTITVDDIRKKIHTLRAQYIKESHTIANHRRNAGSAEDEYKSTLWCFDKLLFLEPHIARRKVDSKAARSNEYDESNIEDEISSDIQSKYSDHRRRSNRLNEYDEGNIKVEISIEDNSEIPTQHHYNSRLNDCDECNMEENTLLKEITPTQNRCNKRSNECDESNIEDNVSNEELSEHHTQHRSKKRKKTTKFDDQIDNVKRLLTKRLEKNTEYDWLGKQVVFEMNKIKNKKIQRDTAWKIQTILREASIADDAVTECQSSQLSRELHSDTQSSCGSCSSNKQQIRSSLLPIIRNSDSIDRSFVNSQNPVRPLHPVRLTSAKSSDTGTSYLYSPDNMQQALDGL